MFKSLPESKYPTGIFYFLTEHTLLIYVQYIKGSRRKTLYLLEKLFEKDLVHFESDDCVFLEIRLAHRNQLLPNITSDK